MMVSAAKGEGKRGQPKRKPNRSGPEVPRGTPANLYPQRMNVATGAQLIGMGRSTLEKKTAAGDVPESCLIRHGKRIIYDRDELLAWKSSPPLSRAG
jgi:hypothetical protein